LPARKLGRLGQRSGNGELASIAKGNFVTTPHGYVGPSVFGYETDALRRAALVSVHTSPLATLGGKDTGGMNVYVRELSCNLAQLGLPIDIFTRRTSPKAPEVEPICDGVNLVKITAGPTEPINKNEIFEYLPEFAAQAALYSVKHGVRYDVVHAHYWLSGWAAQLLKRYWDTPFVQMFHTTAEMKNAVSPAKLHETVKRAQTERLLVDLSDSLIAANPDERAHLIWHQHARSTKVCTIPPGVDVALFKPLDRAECRSQLGLGEDEQVIVFVGRIDPIKGLDTLLDAAVELQSAGSSSKILLIGGDLDERGNPIGPLAEIAAEAETKGVAPSFRFLGSQPQNQLPLYYSAADVVAVPSRYESFGLVAVEAMACGVPVIASRSGGLRFTVEDGLNGFLVPVGDAQKLARALTRVLSDDALRRRLSIGARDSAARFSWPSVASSMLHVYKRLANGYRGDLCCDDEIYA
jgi:D-inositol-3-phosphate glycosyltransferase